MFKACFKLIFLGVSLLTILIIFCLSFCIQKIHREDHNDDETKTTSYEENDVLFSLSLYIMKSSLKNLYQIMFLIFRCLYCNFA